MAENIQSLGYLLKREKLATLATDHSHSELLLESLEPFPGFYEEYFVPTHDRDQKPKSVFIVMKNYDVRHEDDFIRMSKHIRDEHKLQFDAALASIELFNEPATSIRVNMEDYNQLPEFIQHFKKLGVKFQAGRHVKPYQSLIKIRRFFNLEVMSEGVYRDINKPDTYYLKVPLFMTWDEFEKATISIRNNFDYKTYDAAQAAIYYKSDITELVRIYDRKTDLAKLQSLQQKYIIEVERK